MKNYWVYIATNFGNTVFYTGVTNDIERRMAEHRSKIIDGFTKRYNIIKLVYCESFPDPKQAIEAEKKIKGWVRRKKLALIMERNPQFQDLDGNDEVLPSTSG